jgi:hypothetical protein
MLLVGADWALAHGDIGTFAHVSKLLASRTGAALRADLLDLADLCYCDPDLAAKRWPILREQACLELRDISSPTVYH